MILRLALNLIFESAEDSGVVYGGKGTFLKLT